MEITRQIGGHTHSVSVTLAHANVPVHRVQSIEQSTQGARVQRRGLSVNAPSLSRRRNRCSSLPRYQGHYHLRRQNNSAAWAPASALEKTTPPHSPNSEYAGAAPVSATRCGAPASNPASRPHGAGPAPGSAACRDTASNRASLEHSLVETKHLSQLARYREHHVPVCARQQLRALALEPALVLQCVASRAMPMSARVEPHPDNVTRLTTSNMPAQRRRATLHSVNAPPSNDAMAIVAPSRTTRDATAESSWIVHSMHHAEYAILREHETAQQHNKPTAYTLRRQPASPTSIRTPNKHIWTPQFGSVSNRRATRGMKIPPFNP